MKLLLNFTTDRNDELNFSQCLFTRLLGKGVSICAERHNNTNMKKVAVILSKRKKDNSSTSVLK